MGCPGQLTRTTTILHGPLDILQAQKQVRHHKDNKHVHRKSNPEQKRNKSHNWPQQLASKCYRLQYWSRERCVVWRVATSHHWRINVQSWNLCLTNIPWLEGDVATGKKKNTGAHHSAFSMWKKKNTSNPMPRKAIQAHLQIPYRKINYFNGTLTNLKWTCGSMWKKKKKHFKSHGWSNPIHSSNLWFCNFWFNPSNPFGRFR